MKKPKTTKSTFRHEWLGCLKQKCVTLVFLIGLLSCLPMYLLAQNGNAETTVAGRVSGSGEPLIGVTVSSSIDKTITDLDGRYSIKANNNDELTFNYVGYMATTIKVNGRRVVDVDMKEESYALNDVVVVGYGSQKKVNLTGAVSSISTKDLQNKPIANVVEGLQGSSPGLVIQEGTSTPGSVPSVNVRGLNTMNNNSPLVIIDGIEGSLGNLNPSDIEQISVLKDASSTAIYGSRASNGVILVTTKSGSMGRTEVAYNFNYGFQKPTSLPNIADSWVYAELYNEAAVNSGRATKFTAEQIKTFREQGPNCKWIDELYKGNAPEMSHDISLTGGNNGLTYLASFGYVDQNSMFKGPNYGYQRYNARLNVSQQISKRFKVSFKTQFARNDIKEHAYWTEWIIEQCNRMPPIYNIKNEDGSYNYPSGSNSNSLQRLEQGGYRRNTNDELLGSIKGEYKIIDGLTLSAYVGIRMWNNNMHENRHALEGTGDAENKLTEQNYQSRDMTTTVTANYVKTIGKHNFQALLGYSYEGFKEKQFGTSRITEDSKYDVFVGGLSGKDVSNSGYKNSWSMYSGFGRLEYNYDERYLLEFNIRNDYSSYFAKGNRSGLFPSMSAGWRISEEKFWDPIKHYIPSLKIRGSYGTVGNNRIGLYQYMKTVYVNQGYSFGGNLVQTASFSSVNPDIKWESTRMADLGFDIGLLNNDLRLSIDLFSNHTKNILVNLPVPGLFGNGAPIQNAGKVKTRGWEISLNYDFKTGDLMHYLAGNISDSYNKVTDTKGSEIIMGGDVNTIIKEGYPLNSYYAFKADGFFQNEEECKAGPHLDGITPKPGDIRYVDKNGDGVIKADDDRYVVGNDFPRYTFAFSYGFQYKGFYGSMQWQGVGKRKRWMRGESVEAFHNNNEGPVLDFHVDRWTPTHPDAFYPRLTMGSESANNAAKSDFWIFNASYLRLKNVQIGYQFPAKWINKISLKELRVYISGQNLLTFDHMKGGWDPEYNADGSGRAYPVAKVYSFGVNIKF
jgi:TonB-linked SusC/RagA family outer membrane protein